MSRYDRVIRRANNYSTTTMTSTLRNAALDGSLGTYVRVLKEGQRLDHIAGELWGDSQYWWVIAACSGVGWYFQCPPGVELLIPYSLDEAVNLAR